MDKLNFRPETPISGSASSRREMKPAGKAAVHEKNMQPNSTGEAVDKVNIGVPSKTAVVKEALVPHSAIKPNGFKPDLPEKDVTFLFYMNGQYGDLEQSMASAFLELEKSGSSDRVNLVAQLGRAAQREAHPSGGFDRIDHDWSGVRRYYVTQSPRPHNEDVSLDKWMELEGRMPENPLIHYTLGDFYSKEGKSQKAEEEYSLAKKLGYEKFLDEPFDPDVARWSDEFDNALQPLRDREADDNVYASPVKDFKGDINMMHPHNLQDFISWGMKSYPAKHTVLVLMGHGGAWTGSMKMSPSEIGMAIQAGAHEANRQGGRADKIDAVIFNSCYMGNLESVDQLRDSTDVTVASQMSARTNVFYHWPALLGKVNQILGEGREFVPAKLARDFVEFYEDQGEVNASRPSMLRRSKESYLTLVALDNTKIEDLSKAWGKMVKDWKEQGVEDHVIFRNIKKSKNYPSSAYSPEMMFDYGTLRDIGSITINLMNDPEVPSIIKRDCYNIRRALRDAVISEQHTGYNMEGSSGLTVWAPTNAADVEVMKDAYRDRVPTFVQETGWSEKLDEAVKKVDPATLHEFARVMQSLGHVNHMFELPGLSPKEIENLEKKASLLEQEAYQLKKELDLSVPRNKPDFLQGIYDHAKESPVKKNPLLNIPLEFSLEEGG